jgi:GNAT superfamily N-acetyltransferase
MEVVRCESPEEFLSLSESYRLAEPIRTNIMSTVPLAVIAGTRSYAATWWWAVLDDDRCVGAAFRTAPFGLHIGPMPREAASLLANRVAASDDDFPWLMATEAVASAFLGSYRAGDSAGARRRFKRGLHLRLYELGELRSPHVEGDYKIATVNDVELVLSWLLDFERFTNFHAPLDRDDREFTASRLAEGTLRLWIVEGEPVALAGHSPAVQIPGGFITRIGPVYSPEELRGRGYGSAITAALCEEILARGSGVVLNADADYAVSNHVYQKLGFVAIDDLVQYDAAD